MTSVSGLVPCRIPCRVGYHAVSVQVGANAAIIHYKPCASTAATLDRHHMCGTLACTRRLRMRALGTGGGRPSTAAVRSAAVARPTATALRPHGAALRSLEDRECELAGGRAAQCRRWRSASASWRAGGSPSAGGSRCAARHTRRYLVDSGAQYVDGTTDVTRTVHLGEPTEHVRICAAAPRPPMDGQDRPTAPAPPRRQPAALQRVYIYIFI